MVTEATLEAAWQAGCAAWPKVCIERDQLERHLATIADVTRYATDLAGLYLAAAVVAGSAAAAEEIAALLPCVDPVLRRLGADTSRVEDMRQRVLELVVVGGERGPAIAGYAGRSELRSWLRSVAVRTALKAWSREKASRGLDDGDLLTLVDDDPELAVFKAMYADHVVTATREALATLSPRARTLLRLHHLDGLTVDDLATMYKVHRATAARWLVAAREAVFEETRLRLESRLGLGEDSAISVVRLVQSQLVLSMRRLLASQP